MCHETKIPCKRVQCRPLDGIGVFLSKTYTTRTPAAQKNSFGITTTRKRKNCGIFFKLLQLFTSHL